VQVGYGLQAELINNVVFFVGFEFFFWLAISHSALMDQCVWAIQQCFFDYKFV